MRASHVALLSLVASTAAPVFAAPLSYTRSKDGGADLSARSHRGCTGEKSENAVVPTSRPPRPIINDVPNQLNARSSLDDLLADLKTREPDVEQEAHARSSSDNAFGGVERNVPRDETSDFFKALLNSRDLGSGQEIQARSLFSTLFDIGSTILTKFLKRDLNLDHLAARDDAEDFVKSMLGSRDSNGFIDALKTLTSSRRDAGPELLAARNDTEDFVNGFLDALNAHAPSRRDTDPELLAARDNTEDFVNGFLDALNAHAPSRREPEELAARGDWEDFVKIMNTRELGFKRDLHARGLFTGILSWILHKLMSIRVRDLNPDDLAGRNTVDDFFNTYKSTREPSPEQEIQARGIPDAPETVARDGSATDAFIKALLTSRDTSKSLTADDVLSLASLASRALDELD